MPLGPRARILCKPRLPRIQALRLLQTTKSRQPAALALRNLPTAVARHRRLRPVMMRGEFPLLARGFLACAALTCTGARLREDFVSGMPSSSLLSRRDWVSWLPSLLDKALRGFCRALYFKAAQLLEGPPRLQAERDDLNKSAGNKLRG